MSLDLKRERCRLPSEAVGRAGDCQWTELTLGLGNSGKRGHLALVQCRGQTQQLPEGTAVPVALSQWPSFADTLSLSKSDIGAAYTSSQLIPACLLPATDKLEPQAFQTLCPFLTLYLDFACAHSGVQAFQALATALERISPLAAKGGIRDLYLEYEVCVQ